MGTDVATNVLYLLYIILINKNPWTKETWNLHKKSNKFIEKLLNTKLLKCNMILGLHDTLQDNSALLWVYWRTVCNTNISSVQTDKWAYKYWKHLAATEAFSSAFIQTSIFQSGLFVSPSHSDVCLEPIKIYWTQICSKVFPSAIITDMVPFRPMFGY